MKKLALLLLTAFSLIPAAFADQPSRDIVILYKGTSEVNREAIKYLRKELTWGRNLNLRYTQNPADIQPAKVAGVIVLDTGRTGPGPTDSTLNAFLSQYKGTRNVVHVILYSSSSRLFVDSTPAKTSPTGLDTVTSATYWDRKGAKEMHSQWVQTVLTLLGQN